MKTDVEKILEAVSVTAELTGADLSENAKAAMVEELLPFGVGKSLDALNRCRRELTGRLTLAAVLQRIDTGLPSADEAWGLVSEGLRDERVTVVVPAIAHQASAMGAAELLRNGDKTGARMAFKAAYEKLSGGLDLSGGVRWVVERGWDAEDAKTKITEAVRAGRLNKQAALQALPYQATDEREEVLNGSRPLCLDKQAARARLADMSKMLAAKKVAFRGMRNERKRTG